MLVYVHMGGHVAYVDRMGADTSIVKKKHEWNPMAGEEWMEKHQDMEGKRGNGDGHPTRAVAQDAWASPNSPETHLVRKWGNTTHQRAVGPRIILYSTVHANKHT